jgi:hypothetical protein
MDIFRAIMDQGPLSLYSATSQTNIPLGTIHRHFKQLSESGKIRVYQSENKGRKKISYGPTMSGMISFYKTDREFAKKIENYFLIWIENEEFQKELEKEGFDVTLENLKKSKQVFRKYMDYFSAIETKIENIRKSEDEISHDLQIVLGSMLLSLEPTYRSLWLDLCFELPGMKKNLDTYMESTIKSYEKFKKDFKKFHQSKTKQKGK